MPDFISVAVVITALALLWLAASSYLHARDARVRGQALATLAQMVGALAHATHEAAAPVRAAPEGKDEELAFVSGALLGYRNVLALFATLAGIAPTPVPQAPSATAATAAPTTTGATQ
jgi:hypothetical protein